MPSQASKVHVLQRAAMKIDGALLEQFCRELEVVFPDASAITVSECFRGYSVKQDEKIILGVEVRSPHSYDTHVVKLGADRVVSQDYLGWQKCFAKFPCYSRIFVPVSRRLLRNNRAAIVFQSAYHFYGDDQPQYLETAVQWAIHDDKPDPISVEQVIGQIFADIERWFYRSPRVDVPRAVKFYKARLASALDRWTEKHPKRYELRREIVWLLCGCETPELRDGDYVDPYDFVCWTLQREWVPPTLVGNSHGDLHGRNVLVGIQRGRAEYPAVFDYEEMACDNILVWDYVKLETELKVRMLMPLYADEQARETLLGGSKHAARWKALAPNLENSPEVNMGARRAQQWAFAYEFESRLAERTREIHTTTVPGSTDPPGGRRITGNQKLDRALAILLSIRQEAALRLGEHQPQRKERWQWRDEYHFASAVYALATAKWDYQCYESGFALISGGVAVAQLTSTRDSLRQQIQAEKPPAPPYPCYRVPLTHARRLWKARKTAEALRLLSRSARQFQYSVPLLREQALMLADVGDCDKALDLLKPLRTGCLVFHDQETLSRFGRILKDRGDQALDKGPVPFLHVPSHPAWQFYRAAYEQYLLAFRVADPKEKYYPGVNAATLAFLCHKNKDAEVLASETLQICAALDLGILSPDEWFWVLVSEGEASLVLKNSRNAAEYYEQALGRVAGKAAKAMKGMLQPVYNQLCRLHWALGDKIVGPVVAKFKNRAVRRHLKSGPLGNCGQR